MPFYTTLSGTSFATPEASGVVALILQSAPQLTPAQVRSVLQVTGRPIPDVPFFEQGYGYADALAAVELARRLGSLPAPQAQRTLTGLQAERDRQVLAGLAHPERTRAFEDRVPAGPAEIAHTIEVPYGTARLKEDAGTIPRVLYIDPRGGLSLISGDGVQDTRRMSTGRPPDPGARP